MPGERQAPARPPMEIRRRARAGRTLAFRLPSSLLPLLSPAASSAPWQSPLYQQPKVRACLHPLVLGLFVGWLNCPTLRQPPPNHSTDAAVWPTSSLLFLFASEARQYQDTTRSRRVRITSYISVLAQNNINPRRKDSSTCRLIPETIVVFFKTTMLYNTYELPILASQETIKLLVLTNADRGTQRRPASMCQCLIDALSLTMSANARLF